MENSKKVNKRSINLVFETGVEKNGKPVMKIFSFNGVKKDASAENMVKAGKALAGLHTLKLNNVGMSEQVTLSEE